MVQAFTQIITQNQNLKNELEQSRNTLNWISRKYKNADEHNKKLITKIEKDNFILEITKIMHTEWYEIAHAILETSKMNGIDPYLVTSIIHRESYFDKKAQSWGSNSEQPIAQGLMQVNTNVWRKYFNIDDNKIFDPYYNLDIGCKILKIYMEESNGNLNKALLLYNNGYDIRNWKYPDRIMSSKFYKGGIE